MENVTMSIISVLQYLLPGFLAAWIFYAFTSFPKPSQFERTIQALIFTSISQTLMIVLKWICLKVGEIFYIGYWNEQSKIICSTTLACIIGFSFVYFANNDKLHSFIRKLKISKETSYPSEWFGAFLKNVTYIVLHLKDERRLYGWPIEWPSEPDKGHFVLEQVSWLIDEKCKETSLDETTIKTKEIPLNGVNSILINVHDVKWVEFLEKTWEKNNE
jgi:hypothetical protein